MRLWGKKEQTPIQAEPVKKAKLAEEKSSNQLRKEAEIHEIFAFICMAWGTISLAPATVELLRSGNEWIFALPAFAALVMLGEFQRSYSKDKQAKKLEKAALAPTR